MAKRGGFIGQDGINAPDEPTGVTGTAGDGQVEVSFTAPSDAGGAAITGYSVRSNTGETTLNGSITGAYDSKSFNVSSQAGAAGGVQFKSDGTKMYVTGQTSDKTFQYSLSTPYDVSTASYDSVELNHAAQLSNANPYDLFFKTDGTKLYVMFGINDTVYQYGLSTPWDLSTASYDDVNFSVAPQESGEPGGLAFSDDGSKMYACGEGQATVFQYTLSTPWDLSTASYASKSFDVSDQDTKPAGLAFAKNGQLMLVVGEAQVKVFLYVLTTPFDVSTAAYTSSSFSVSSQDPRPWYIALADSNTKMYVGGPNNDTVYQYTVGLSVDYPTESPVTVTGLTNDTSYTFNVWAINPFGWSSPSDASGSVTPVLPPKYAVFAGGVDGSGTAQNTMNRVDMNTTGNASDFGNLVTATLWFAGCASSTRGLFGGGFNAGFTTLNTISFTTFSSAGGSTDFGDLTVARYALAAGSSETRGLFAGGGDPVTTTIDYVTIAAAGNATDFGDLTGTGRRYATGASSGTRSFFANGQNSSSSNQQGIDYVVTSTTGNASDWGDTTATSQFPSAAANGTRMLIALGYTSSPSPYVNRVDFITTASTGNASDFGDLSADKHSAAGAASPTLALFGGGRSTVNFNTIDYFTIATTGNAQDFGDLTYSPRELAACSGSHGGLS